MKVITDPSNSGSFSETEVMLSYEALNAIVKLENCLCRFVDLLRRHALDLFLYPILSYGEKYGGFPKQVV